MSEHIHNFQELSGGGYFKRNIMGGIDESRRYATLFCAACGETKQVLAEDRTGPNANVDLPLYQPRSESRAN